MWTPFIVGAVVAVLAGLARASMRAIVITGGIALIVCYLAFPFATAVGFVSRDTIKPTLLGVTPLAPMLVLVLLAGIGAAVAPLVRRRAGGILAAVGGVISVVVVQVWQTQQPELVHLRPLFGLMEALTAVAAVLVVTVVGWGSKRVRIITTVVGLAAGALLLIFLLSPAGATLFPAAKGYYKLVTPSTAAEQQSIVDQYNLNLDLINTQRQRIGLRALNAIDSTDGLATERLPEAAAAAGYRMLRPAENGYGVAVVYLLAGLLVGGGLMLVWRPRLHAKGDLTAGLLYATAIVILAPAFASTEFGFRKIIEGWPFLLNFLDRAWPPLLADPNYGQFGIYPLQEVASQMLITLEIALVGTFLGALFAIPMSFLASRNLTRGSPFMRLMFALTRGFFNLDRGVDTLILALIFVAAVGLGPLAGVLAMAIHSIADLGKLYSESIENVDKGPIEALAAVGASGTNVVRWSILPQVAPLILGWTLYRFEINFRVSIVLGLVGAGGIGFFIQDKMSSGRYDQMIIAIIAIVIVVNIIDFASSWLRGKLL